MGREIGLRQFALSIGKDPGQLSRWETGERTPAPTDVAQILGKLDVHGKRYDELVELARQANEDRWFAGSLAELRDQWEALADFERTASAIINSAALVIPGLLQTPDYTRTIMIDGGVPAEEVERRVAIRIDRQRIITRSDPVRFTALVGEGALHQCLGGERIMAAQMARLTELAALPNIEIRIVPFDSGWHPGLDEPIYLIESRSAIPVVYLELHRLGLFLHKDSDLDAYRATVATIAERAMTVDDSLAVISLAKTRWESG